MTALRLGSIEITDFSEVESVDFFQEKDTFPVNGWIVHEGVHNRQTFTKEELERAAPTFIGRPIVKDHLRGVDDVVGRVTDTQYEFDESKGKWGISFTGNIGSEHEKLYKDLKRQFVSDTSMRLGYPRPFPMETHFCNICGEKFGKCSHAKSSNLDYNPIATDFYGKHVSIVTEPADRDTAIGVSFEDSEGHVYNDFTEFLGRTTMSDQFEEKYIKLMDDFNDFKDEKKTEIDELKAEFKDQKTQMEKDFADKVEENLKLQNEFNDLKTEKEALEQKVEKFEADFAKIEEEKLGALRTEVTELNEKVHGNLTEDQINSFEEATLSHYVSLFTSIADNMTTKVTQNVKVDNNYSDNQASELGDDHISNLTNLVQDM